MFHNVNDAIEDIKIGKMVIVIDDEGRENEGDLIFAASTATPDKINFLTKEGRGLICVALDPDRIEELNLPLMVQKNDGRLQTAFTVSVEVKKGTTTGISAKDRCLTALALVDPNLSSNDFISPGHVFPLKARKGGVLVRAGHTEAAVDLVKSAGLPGGGVICEILNEDGSMARLPDLKKFSEKFKVKIISIADIISYRRQKELLVKLVASPNLPTTYGDFQAFAFKDLIHGQEHLALVKGKIKSEDKILVRVHSECLTGDAFASKRCDCGIQLDIALKIIGEKGGVLLYMRQEGRGIGLHNKMKAYELQDKGYDTVEANHMLGFKSDMRTYGIGAQILYELGVRKIRLLTNNPKKSMGLEGYGLSIDEQLPIYTEPNEVNRNYLSTKNTKMGHRIPNV